MLPRALPRSPGLYTAVVEELVPHKKLLQSSRKVLQNLVDVDEVRVGVKSENAFSDIF